MTRYKIVLPLFLLAVLTSGWAQQKQEREFRIRKDQFPPVALEAMEPFLADARRLRYYKEIDSARSSFELKFKLQRLWYSVEFTPEGVLEDVEVRIKPVDIPDETWARMQSHMTEAFGKHRVRKIQQQYPREAFDSVEVTMKNAFQNLLLPQLRYELVIQTRTQEGLTQYEALYDSEGALLLLREALPPNYNHILY
ncbi:hypothetical protein [Robiginitalea sp. SC105]|uniref:hypothetical protein n=1 Tax=Robiginitalea sp. SC105 TaxID=2762332 RepID=UPI00163AD716|nr:hypothetical protein [Robiginitalea sp. SC105]MBC2837933.1 hypothetical protein [Robiginitalea sp. SC105]